jgi:hypothetical protein
MLHNLTVRLLLSLLIALGLAASAVESARPDMCFATSAANASTASSEASPAGAPVSTHIHAICHCSFPALIGLPASAALPPIATTPVLPLPSLSTERADVLAPPLVPPPIA